MTKDLLTKIRLSNDELLAIQQSFRTIFLPSDHLWLFGSRANINKKGGDIDLYIETNINDFTDTRARENALVLMLWNQIGEQRVDVVINILSENKQLAIYKIARDTGIQLL